MEQSECVFDFVDSRCLHSIQKIRSENLQYDADFGHESRVLAPPRILKILVTNGCFQNEITMLFHAGTTIWALLTASTLDS